MKLLKTTAIFSIVTITTACAYTASNPEPSVHAVNISSETNSGLLLGAHGENWDTSYPNRVTFNNAGDNRLTTAAYNETTDTCSSGNFDRIAYPRILASNNDGVAVFKDYNSNSFLNIKRALTQLRTKHPTAELVFSLGKMKLADDRLTGGVGHSIHGRYEPLVDHSSNDWNDEGKFILSLRGLNGNRSIRLAETSMKQALITYNYWDPEECMDDFLDFQPFDENNNLDPLEMVFNSDNLPRELVQDITAIVLAVNADTRNKQLSYCFRIPNSLAYVPSNFDFTLQIGQPWGQIQPFAILKTDSESCSSAFPEIRS